ncbi:DUF2336 domain-containing protein [Brevundimonas sp.]|uniref:DUF2336 domain-containing protein n=1 Tax=Brevundimonas sp. TaxID=1871086 RepID=UPI003782D4E9
MTAVAALQSFRPAPQVSVPPSELLALAKSRTTDDRQRLLLGIAALCDATPTGAEVSPVLTEIFMTLARQAEHDIRKSLAESLAGADWAPLALVNMLALDEIEIARPIIASSPLLRDQDLLRILVEATIEHQIEVARRPALSGRVADAIIDAAEPATMTALASNRTAEISETGLHRLIEQSRRIAALRAPLTRHPRLNETLARELYSLVGVALRQAIGERFRVDDAALSNAIDGAVSSLRDPVPVTTLSEREEMERRLIDKLQSAGQLRAGFLIRAVREKRLTLFEHGLAALGGFTIAQVRAAVMRPTPEALFLACTAVGIDRAVFSAILEDIRKLTRGSPGEAQGSSWTAMTLSPSAAAKAFRDMTG